ncbi:hypothetical protein [Nannocystis radixulma]|uniref:Peptidase C-terminal archaeal/bacterial domain-containing protein n=1 Tax=Nannocystis radixulma TaxID=2995305 RepID=A0ABT5B503_9BACT|nr:hypothetical protein [Nannocystis radixulma]MDC0668793.1 hypothetical protein [Nannocystis radixulma]
MPRVSLTTIRITPIVAVLSALLRAHPAYAAPVTNDDFADALEISALPFSDQLKTNSASTDPDIPDNAGCGGQAHSVWYQYTPLVDEFVHADTFGSDYDTTLSVFTDSSGQLIEVVCNDDFFQRQSSVDFAATAGVTYYFMVASFEGTKGGDLIFNLQNDPPPLAIDVPPHRLTAGRCVGARHHLGARVLHRRCAVRAVRVPLAEAQGRPQ